VGGDSHHKIQGKHATHVVGDRHLLIDGSSFSGVKGDLNQGSQGDQLVWSKQELSLFGNTSVLMGTKGTMDVHGGVKLVIEANTLISLKVGSSGIVIDPSGVSIVGPIIKQNSGGAPSSAIETDTYDVDAAHGTHSTKDGQVTKPVQQLQAQALRNAALAGQPFCAECEAARAALEALRS